MRCVTFVSMSILVVDNYDSFTFNLVHLIQKLSDEELVVKRNDEITLAEVARFDRILFSPGPGLPSEAGLMPEIIKAYHTQKDMLGVCLGLQAIVEFFGGSLKNLDEVLHGRAMDTIILDSNDRLFRGIDSTFAAGRYHSWVADKNTLPDVLKLTATDDMGEVMAITHRTMKISAVQFHPESILTPDGELIIKNWLK